MAPSTVRALTLSPLGAISPDLYLTAKICSSAMGSESCESRGSMASSMQNERHRLQWFAVAESVEALTINDESITTTYREALLVKKYELRVASHLGLNIS